MNLKDDMTGSNIASDHKTSINQNTYVKWITEGKTIIRSSHNTLSLTKYLNLHQKTFYVYQAGLQNVYMKYFYSPTCITLLQFLLVKTSHFNQFFTSTMVLFPETLSCLNPFSATQKLQQTTF